MKIDRIWHFLLVYYACLEQSATWLLVLCQNETIKKVQSQRFALQELLKQFLLVYRYCTSIFLFHKKAYIFME